MSSTQKIPKLNNSNYQIWKFNIEAVLLEETGIDFTELNEDIGDKKANAKALRVIRNSVTDQVIPFIRTFKSAYATWNQLKSQYDIIDEETVFDKLVKFLRLQKKPSDTMHKYISKQQQLFTEINNLKLEGGLDRISEFTLKANIIKGLPEYISNKTIEWDIPKLSLIQLKNKLDNIVTHQTNVNSVTSKKISTNKSVKNANSTNNIYCTICKTNTNHTYRGCAKAHCKKCQGYGHITADCKKDQTNAVTTNDNNDEYWLIDTGSSNHFIDNPSKLKNMVHTDGEAIVANGQKVKYEAKGYNEINVNNKIIK